MTVTVTVTDSVTVGRGRHRRTVCWRRRCFSGSELRLSTSSLRVVMQTECALRAQRSRNALDRDRRSLRLTDSKTGPRVIPLSSQALEALDPLPRGEPEDLMFPGTNGVSPIAITRPWYRVRAVAGIDRTANLHCLRHTFASWSVMGGLSLPQVGAVLGHRSAQTTLRYADHRLEAVRAYSQQVGDAFDAMGNQPEHVRRSRDPRPLPE